MEITTEYAEGVAARSASGATKLWLAGSRLKFEDLVAYVGKEVGDGR